MKENTEKGANGMIFDTLICDGRVIDGLGTAPQEADLGILDGKIAAIGNLCGAQARQRIDAAGRYVTPGFWDIHRHADAAAFRAGFGRLELAQGLTSIINGNCGLSVAPAPSARQDEIFSYLAPVLGSVEASTDAKSMAAYLASLARTPLRLNAGMLVGSGTVRAAVAGCGTEQLTPEQVQQIHRLLEQSLAEGALGVSLGLGYAPECFYTPQELVQALAPLRDSGKVITVHMRQEGAGVAQALEEMLALARELRTPVHISHLKAIGRQSWRHAVPQMLRMMQQAREEGLDVSCDLYPYEAGSTQLIHVLPPESQRGGLETLSRKLREPAFRAALRERMENGTDFENIVQLVGWENVCVTTLASGQHPEYIGKNIAELAEQAHMDAYDFAFDLLAEEHCMVAMIDFIAHEDDICDILRDSHSCVISDSTYPSGGRLHPRVYGTYARLLERFVREKQVLTLPQAVQKITSRPADLFGFTQKGRLAVGCDADINIFDLANIHETASYLDPEQLAQGMDYVLVNGVPAIADGKFTDAFSGSVLRR